MATPDLEATTSYSGTQISLYLRNLPNHEIVMSSNIQDIGEGHYVGPLPVEIFLEEFMDLDGDLSAAPIADFSAVLPVNQASDMYVPLIQAIEKSGLCPGLRVFVTRNMKRWGEPGESIDEHRQRRGNETAPDLCAAMAVRKERQGHRVQKKKNVPKKRKTYTEYHYFSDSLLGIETHPVPWADPFTDPDDHNQQRSSEGSSASTVAHSPISEKRRLSPKPSSSTNHAGGSGGIIPVSPVAVPPAMLLSGLKPTRDSRNRSAEPSDGQRPSASHSSQNLDYPFPRDLKEAATFRASILSHAQIQLSLQHRTCFFQVVLTEQFARFIRWDRSGAVITERINYVLEPEILSEFLWRFAHMTDEQRGLDPTATSASKAEIKSFEDAVEEFLGDMDAVTKTSGPARNLLDSELTLDPTSTYPTWKVHVVDEVSSKATNLVLRRPFAGHSSLFGRSTRGYIAYDLTDKRLVFLKDTWRAVHRKLRPEYRTYQELQKHSVPHVPMILYGGDVLGKDGKQMTLSQEYASGDAEWRRVTRDELQRHVHHRLVQDIAFPLESAVDEREFIQALHDILCAIESAYDTAGFLHRDPSIGNMMIDSRGRGVLNDWDHAGRTNAQARGIGTWKFMPIRLLKDPTKIHDLADDLESVFWVLVYGALKRFALPDQFTPMHIFDSAEGAAPSEGARWKNECLDSGDLREIRFTCESLQELIQKSSWAWNAYHRALKGARGFDHVEDLKAKIMETSTLVSKPAYWIEKFATALRDCDARDPSLPSTMSLSPLSRQTLSRNKRKASDHNLVADLRSHHNMAEPRRSKRLKKSAT